MSKGEKDRLFRLRQFRPFLPGAVSRDRPFRVFPGAQQQREEALVTGIYPRSACITPYGTVNASEDFAESYACYMRDPEALKLLPEKYAFMRDCIFSGDPATLKERN
jgi:hypothetical protein